MRKKRHYPNAFNIEYEKLRDWAVAKDGLFFILCSSSVEQTSLQKIKTRFFSLCITLCVMHTLTCAFIFLEEMPRDNKK